MSSEDLFELYNVPVVPSSKKDSTRHRGESSKAPPMKKARTGDPPTTVPSQETTPPQGPLDQTSTPAPTDQTSPLAPNQTPPQAPTSQTPPAQIVMSIMFSSAKERLSKLSRHLRSQEAITSTDSMEVNHIINHALNEIASGMLTMIVNWRRSGALITQLKTSEAKHAEELKKVEAKHNEQLEATKAKHAEQLKAVEKTNAELLDQKNKLEAKQLEAELVASRKDTEEMERRIKELEETNASNLERYKGATFNCFYEFWKHNHGADLSYLSECLRRSQIAWYLARLEKEERAKIPASPEISLAMGIEGTEVEAGASGLLTVKNSWHRAKEVDSKHDKEIKAWEAKVKAVEDKVVILTEELKKSQEDLAMAIAGKDKFKEASETNLKEATKLQEDLEKNNQDVNFDYLLDQVKQAELAKCATRLEEEKSAPESSEISLAMEVNGAEEEAETYVDQQPQQDPPSATH
ncbi:protein WEAK CHLOROPLAST MOVEMENT UNDER BLUE LIGHT-like 3 [Humulus lupulus]|uniref:protein WEAK CHLOROPLAST MOVEMENT UNDER BLUE LIGHT-like 3 n=1 Tax=Humulus lupulus TaxID=3486 RepID=UPI002B40B580|nr:protein WEAK CHLOROPLAST MOVEMENT UNDER BLUE LIGHT-like 3 [Humulus lupulus]